MLRSIKRSHAGRALDPGHDVLQFGIDLATGFEKFIEVLPIHAHEVDRAVFAVVLKEGTATGQKANKLFSAELSGPLRELAMADLSVAGYVAIDANIVRGVNEDDVRAAVCHQSRKSSLGRCIAAMDVMAPEPPDIADMADRHPRHRAGIIVVLDSRLTEFLDRQIDLGQAEPGD